MNNLKATFFLVFLLFLAASPAVAGERLAGPYKAQVVEVIDGDTFRARVHIWLGQDSEMLIRLDGIDTPELHGRCAQERTLSQQARPYAGRGSRGSWC